MLERNEKKMNWRTGEPYWITRVQKGVMWREKLNKLYKLKKQKKKKQKKKTVPVQSCQSELVTLVKIEQFQFPPTQVRLSQCHNGVDKIVPVPSYPSEVVKMVQI